MEDEVKSRSQTETETECLAEITEVLKKHNCIIEVRFQQDVVLGTPVLKYIPTVVYDKAKLI